FVLGREGAVEPLSPTPTFTSSGETSDLRRKKPVTVAELDSLWQSTTATLLDGLSVSVTVDGYLPRHAPHKLGVERAAEELLQDLQRFHDAVVSRAVGELEEKREALVERWEKCLNAVLVELEEHSSGVDGRESPGVVVAGGDDEGGSRVTAIRQVIGAVQSWWGFKDLPRRAETEAALRKAITDSEEAPTPAIPSAIMKEKSFLTHLSEMKTSITQSLAATRLAHSQRIAAFDSTHYSHFESETQMLMAKLPDSMHERIIKPGRARVQSAANAWRQMEAQRIARVERVHDGMLSVLKAIDGFGRVDVLRWLEAAALIEDGLQTAEIELAGALKKVSTYLMQISAEHRKRDGARAEGVNEEEEEEMLDEGVSPFALPELRAKLAAIDLRLSDSIPVALAKLDGRTSQDFHRALFFMNDDERSGKQRWKALMSVESIGAEVKATVESEPDQPTLIDSLAQELTNLRQGYISLLSHHKRSLEVRHHLAVEHLSSLSSVLDLALQLQEFATESNSVLTDLRTRLQTDKETIQIPNGLSEGVDDTLLLRLEHAIKDQEMKLQDWNMVLRHTRLQQMADAILGGRKYLPKVSDARVVEFVRGRAEEVRDAAMELGNHVSDLRDRVTEARRLLLEVGEPGRRILAEVQQVKMEMEAPMFGEGGGGVVAGGVRDSPLVIVTGERETATPTPEANSNNADAELESNAARCRWLVERVRTLGNASRVLSGRAQAIGDEGGLAFSAKVEAAVLELRSEVEAAGDSAVEKILKRWEETHAVPCEKWCQEFEDRVLTTVALVPSAIGKQALADDTGVALPTAQKVGGLAQTLTNDFALMKKAIDSFATEVADMDLAAESAARAVREWGARARRDSVTGPASTDADGNHIGGPAATIGWSSAGLASAEWQVDSLRSKCDQVRERYNSLLDIVNECLTWCETCGEASARMDQVEHAIADVEYRLDEATAHSAGASSGGANNGEELLSSFEKALQVLEVYELNSAIGELLDELSIVETEATAAAAAASAHLSPILSPRDEVAGVVSPLTPETPISMDGTKVSSTLPPEMSTLKVALGIRFQHLVDEVQRVRSLLAGARRTRTVLDGYLRQAEEVRAWIQARLNNLRTVEGEIDIEATRLLTALTVAAASVSSGSPSRRSSLAAESVGPTDGTMSDYGSLESEDGMVAIGGTKTTPKRSHEEVAIASAIDEAAIRVAERRSAITGVVTALERYERSWQHLQVFAAKVVESCGGGGGDRVAGGLAGSRSPTPTPNFNMVKTTIEQEQNEINKLWQEMQDRLVAIRVVVDRRSDLIDWAKRTREDATRGAREAASRIESGEGWSAVLARGSGGGGGGNRGSISSLGLGFGLGGSGGNNKKSMRLSRLSRMSRLSMSMSGGENILDSFGRCVDDVVKAWEDEVMNWEEEIDRLGQQAWEFTGRISSSNEALMGSRSATPIQNNDQPKPPVVSELEQDLIDAVVDAHMRQARKALSKLQLSFEDHKCALFELSRKIDGFVMKAQPLETWLDENIESLRVRLYGNRSHNHHDRRSSRSSSILSDITVLTGGSDIMIMNGAYLYIKGNEEQDKMSLKEWVREQVTLELKLRGDVSVRVNELTSTAEDVLAMGREALSGAVLVLVVERVKERSDMVKDRFNEIDKLAQVDKKGVERATQWLQWHTALAKFESDVNSMIERVQQLHDEGNGAEDEELLDFEERMQGAERAVEALARSAAEGALRAVQSGAIASERANATRFRERHEAMSRFIVQLGTMIAKLREETSELRRTRSLEEQLDKVAQWCQQRTVDFETHLRDLPPNELLQPPDFTSIINEEQEQGVCSGVMKATLIQNALTDAIKLQTSVLLELSQQRHVLATLQSEVVDPNRLYILRDQLNKVETLAQVQKALVEDTQRLFAHDKAAIEIVTWLVSAGATSNGLRDAEEEEKGINYETLIAEVSDLEDRLNNFEGSILRFVEIGEAARKSNFAGMIESSLPDALPPLPMIATDYSGAVNMKTQQVLDMWESLRENVASLHSYFDDRAREHDFTRAADEVYRILEGIKHRLSSVNPLAHVASRPRLFGASAQDPETVFKELEGELEGIVAPRLADLREKAFLAARNDAECERYLARERSLSEQVKALVDLIESRRRQMTGAAIARKFHTSIHELRRLLGEFSRVVEEAATKAAAGVTSSSNRARGAGSPQNFADGRRGSADSAMSATEDRMQIPSMITEVEAEALAGSLDGKFIWFDGEVRGQLEKLESLAEELGEMGRYKEIVTKWESLRAWKDAVKEDLLRRARAVRRGGSGATTPTSMIPISTSPIPGARGGIPRIRASPASSATSTTSSVRRGAYRSSRSPSPRLFRNTTSPVPPPPPTPPPGANGPRGGTGTVRIFLPSPNHYVPNPRDPLDVEVARIVNECPMSIKVSCAGAGKYWFGELLPKLCYCRIIRDQHVMVRVGGGWQVRHPFSYHHITHPRHSIHSAFSVPFAHILTSQSFF
ncbi:hypothetical protein HK102_003115, partial [Quaeritorhiza haematococci]